MSKSKVQYSRNSITNPLESLINVLPCDRPIKSLQIVESFDSCPRNFHPIFKTHDSDTDADLWRENILFGKRNTRYLCISKTEGLPNYVLEKIKVIGEKEAAPEGFSMLSRTADSEQKAWRKKQIVYKLAKTESVTECITDIIICSKHKQAPEGFHSAGDIEKLHLCYKIAPLKTTTMDTSFQEQIENLKLQSNNLYPGIKPTSEEHYYEQLQMSYQISPSRITPVRAAPLPPLSSVSNKSFLQSPIVNNNTGTLSHYHTELYGVPFILNPQLQQTPNATEELPNISKFTANYTDSSIGYDFQIERQILCTTTGNLKSTNPFFN